MSPYTVNVEKHVLMLPSVVEEGSPIVKNLQESILAVDGNYAELVYGRGAFDAGGPTSMGIPTVMYGRPIHNPSVMGDDFVSIKGVKEEAEIIGRLAMNILS